MRFGVTVNGACSADLYVALVFPGGYFMTIEYPLDFSWPNVIAPYQSDITFSGETNYSILNIPLPAIEKGIYNCIGLLCTPGGDPWDVESWIFSDVKTFEMK